jgi:hypothetical protein
MNMKQSVLEINVLLVLLLSNSVFFGMKRTAESESQIVSSKKTHVDRPATPIEKLNQAFIWAKPSLNVDILKDIIIQDVDIDKLPVYEKLSILGDFDKEKREKIDRLQAQRLEILLALPADTAKQRINYELKTMDQILCQNEIDTQNELRQAYGIDSYSKKWRIRMLEAQARRKFDIDGMKEKWSTTTWNPHLPEHLAKAVTEAIQKNGLEPTAFNIGIFEESDEEFKTALAGFRSPVTSIVKVLSPLIDMNALDKQPLQVSFGYKKNKPARIRFSPDLAHKNAECINHVMHHEITHGLKGHAAIEHSIVTAITECTGAEKQDIRLHPAYTKFKLAKEISADASRALRDPEIARCGILNPGLYAESYGVIAMANTNWKALEKINTRECQPKLLKLKTLK